MDKSSSNNTSSSGSTQRSVAVSKPLGFGTVKNKKWKVTAGGSYPAGLPFAVSRPNTYVAPTEV